MSIDFGSQVMTFGFGSLAVGRSAAAAINNISSNKRAFSEMSSNDIAYAAMAAANSPSPNIDMNIYGSTPKLALTLTSGSGETGKNKVDEEYESRSGSDNVDGNGSGDDQEDNQPQRKKTYHRHTPQQIQDMEAFFKEFPHPDEKQRQSLSRKLNLAPRQIKFWFQNRRTQLKTHQERQDNVALRNENDKLRRENTSMKEAMTNPTCCNCGGFAMLGNNIPFEEQQLRIENARLKDELEKVSAITGKLCGRPLPQMVSHSPMHNANSLGIVDVSADVNNLNSLHSSVNPTSDFLHGLSVVDVAAPAGSLSGFDKSSAERLALASMDEFLRLAQMQHPMWMPSPNDGIKETLNYEEYYRQFPRVLRPKPFGYKTEANRHAGTVMMNGLNLVETLMDANHCAEMFPSIISRATTLDVLFHGVDGTRNGELQLMYMELHVLSPLGPTREVYFLRLCQQRTPGMWAVVDVSIDSLIENPPPSLMKCRRRPSGCIIQELPNNCSKVIWLEHTDFEDTGVHSIYRSLVNSGMAFSSLRWFTTLQSECERLALLMDINIDPVDSRARLSLLKLARKMTKDFCTGVSASNINNWSTLPGNEDIKVTTRKSIENPGQPGRVVLSASTSVWLSVSPSKLCDFLRDERLRIQWDMLSTGQPMQEITRIVKGQDRGNSVSLLGTNTISSNQTAFVLQECCTDASGSLFVYAPSDLAAMHSVLNGGDPGSVDILPSGFVILPDGPRTLTETGSSSNCMRKGGSILTVAFQIMLHTTVSPALEDVEVIQNLISSTVQKIKSALICEEA